MHLNEINNKIKEINQIRSRIQLELNNNESDDFSVSNKQLNRAFSSLNELKIACIMDDFTYYSFAPECELLQITPGKWREELENFQPDFFFLESAWRGYAGLWKTKIDHLSNDLIDILIYCKDHDIPIVFWNKEDPVHYETFLETAKFADFIFTTDIDCIKKYKIDLDHDQVYLLPFAAQTKYHNPIELYERADKVCFAGAYYKRFTERSKDFNTLVNNITSSKDLVIFDRNFNNKDSDYKFPSSYNRYIKGTLNPEEIGKAYKGYLYNINMNSVKQSQTMCARRVFELVASNTITISNYSRAIRNLFGDLVVCTDDGKRLIDMLQWFNDPEYLRKFRLLGLRKVLAEHTYRERLAFIVEKLYGSKLANDSIKVAVIGNARTEEEIKRIIKQYQRQVYKNKKLFILTDISYNINNDDIKLINNFSLDIVESMKNEFEYWTFFSSKDYYGRNYITDFVLSLGFSTYAVITKSTNFINCNNKINRITEFPPYHLGNNARVRKAFVQVSKFSNNILINLVRTIDEGLIEAPTISIDEYNYCMEYDGDECLMVDDLDLTDTGIPLDTLNGIADQIKPEKTIDINYKVTNDSGCYLNKSKVLLITQNYPDYNNLYRSAFIHSRLLEYKRNGLVVDVFKYNEHCKGEYSEFAGIDITSGKIEEINNVLLYGRYDTILIHFLTETIWNSIKHLIKGKRIIVWVHGAEIQPWWRRKHNYSNEVEVGKAKIETEKRLNFWREIFNLALEGNDYDFHFVFVSHYLAQSVIDDTKVKLTKNKYSIIHNYINSDLFTYVEKDREFRKKILSIRPFANNNYANDLTVKAILELSKEPFFNDLEFRIVGDGELFSTIVRPLKRFKNVCLEKKFLRQEEIAELHKEYGVFIVPTRMDSQGVSRDEAMSSGLVPITNKVAAIPEFLDEECGMLVGSEDYHGLAESVKKLYLEPDLFQKLSRNAAERVRRQCNIKLTIIKEMELIIN